VGCVIGSRDHVSGTFKSANVGAQSGSRSVSDAFPGRIYKLMPEGKLLGTLGRSGKKLKQFGWVHEMACPKTERALRRRASELEGAETHAGRVKQLT
jgi:hypothetical protein